MGKEHIKYTTIREDFNEYEIENGQILKFKLMLSDVVSETKDGKNTSMMGLKDVSVVITDISIDTSNLELAQTEVTENDEREELRFKTIVQVVNIYETRNTIILIAPIVAKVLSTNKKDRDGNPILRFTYNQQIMSVNKTDLFDPTKIIARNAPPS
jgi:hypothetical protein